MKNIFFKPNFCLALIGWLLLSASAFAQCTITGTVNASSLNCGTAPLNSCNGILYIGNGVIATSVNLNSDLNLTCLGAIQLIVNSNANLSFSPGNDRLMLAAGSSITIMPGGSLIGGSCNASERIYIGANLFASCNGGAGADVSFATLVTLGGTGYATANSPICVGSALNLSAIQPPNGNYTYSWSGPGLFSTPFSNNPNFSLAATVGGTYQVIMKSNLPGSPSTIAEVAVTVIALPTKPIIGTVTQPTCTVSTGNVVINSLPSTGTWTLIRSGSSSAMTSGTGSSTTVFGLPLGTYTFQVSNGTCTSTASANVVITPVSSAIWNGTTWSSPPTLAKNIVFNGNYAENADVDACSCQVLSGAVVIKPGQYLNVSKAVTVLGGSLKIDDTASLVQIDDSAVNFGNIIVNRSAMVKKSDYVYWSAPVVNFPLTSISPTTLTAHLWKWIPTINGSYGNWTNADENMIKAKGYIVRGPSVFNDVTAQKFIAAFSGTPNNGIITPAIARGNYQGPSIPNGSQASITNQDDNHNLIGNPYPSAIRALDFLALNTNLEGNVRLWTHGTLPSASVSSPFYNNFTFNYTAADYIIYNGTGTISGPSGFNGYIASGQGFFVTMIDGPATTATVTFNNAMRSKTYNNKIFFRNGASQDAADSPGRIWLDLVASGGAVSRTLVGYVAGASNANDRMFDAQIKLDSNQNFYSIASDQKFCIQGRALPFTNNDIVSLGFQSPVSASYSIAIAAIDGLFLNSQQHIYLQDNLLNIVHDLKQSPYTFSTIAGAFNSRFQLVYTNANTINPNFFNSKDTLPETNTVAVLQQSEKITIASSADLIKDVTVYNLLGVKIYSKEGIDDVNFEVAIGNEKQSVLIVKIGFVNGKTATKKIIQQM